MAFEVAYAARIQVDQLEQDEREELESLFSDPQPQATQLQPHRPGGLLISRLGRKRVLWHRREETGTPEILSVVDQSYAAA